MMLEEKGYMPADVRQVVPKIRKILERFGIERAWIFGSALEKGMSGADDIDIIIDPPAGFSLLDLSMLAVEIEDVTGKDVDILTRRSIDPLIAEHIRGVRIL